MDKDADDWMHKYESALLDSKVSINSLVPLVSEHFPKMLYRYGSFEQSGWEEVMFRGIVHVSSPYYFNDPFDCELSLTDEIIQLESIKKELIKKLESMFKLKEFDIKRILYSDNLIKDIEIVASHFRIQLNEDYFIRRIKEALEEGCIAFKKSIGVICFSEDPFSILMWSHYAHYHSGYCIEFEFPSNSNIFNSTYPVIYSRNKEKYSEQIKQQDDRWVLKAMLCKSSDWSYEHEWRYLSIKIPPSSSIEFPEINLNEYIKGIYLGAKISYENEKKICKFGKEHNLQIFKMMLSNDQYKLIPEQIV
jgi:hypothetical protein